MEASTTAMSVEMRPMPIELISGRMNCDEVRIPWKFPQVHWAGRKDGSRTAVGVLKDSETSQSTGISASAITTKLAVAQPVLWRGVMAAISGSPLSDVRARGRGAEALDEQEGDDRDADEDQDRDCRPDAQVQRVEQVVVAEDRDRSGAVGAHGEDVDVVEDPERVQCPEQQGDQDRRRSEEHTS